MLSDSCFPITQANLEEQIDAVNALLKTTKWKPGKHLQKASEDKDGKPINKWVAASAQTTPEDTLSIVEIAQAIAMDKFLLPEGTNLMLRTIRTGVALGLHLAGQYRISSGLKELDEQKKAGLSMTPNQKDEFDSKINTKSAVALYTAASYIVWKLGSYKPEKVSSTIVPFNGVPEITLQAEVAAMRCMLYWFGSSISAERTGFVGDEIAMIAVALKYFGAIVETVKQRVGSLKFTDQFTKVSYKLEDSDFSVQGFNSLCSTVAVSAEFSPVEDRMIVGNRIAKHEARRIVKMILLYCSKRKMNPIMALGGLTSIRMGYGKPGTGKTLIIRYIATEFKKYCEMRGIPFLFWLFPSNMVSTFQGGTAERALEWWKRLRDLDKIIYAAIDDAEQNFEERTRQGVSAGVRENISVALVQTEGAGIVNPGNYLIDFMTNIPEQMDTAILSRIQSKFPINGAETWQDFVDQDYLWMEKYNKADPAFCNTKKPAGYEYLANQKLVASVSALEREATKPSDQRILEVFDQLIAEGHNPDEDEFYGLLYERIHEIYPYFTSRDIRNIQQAISARIMDFEVPESWFEDMKIYFEQEYSVKEGLVNDLMVGNMKGLSFADIRLREMVKYVDNLSTIANVDRERRIAAYMADQEIRNEAERRYRESLEVKRMAMEAAKKHPLDNRK